MKKLLLLSLAISSLGHAEVIKGRIHSVENNLVKFENGRVAYLDSKLEAASAGDLIKVEVDEKSSILSLKNYGASAAPSNMNLLEETAPVPFEPTIVPSMDEAWNIFNRSNPNYKRISECTDRAHVWAHDEFKATGTKSEKVFVFFTASYINRVRLKWWFHVAPLYTVSNNGNIQKLAMDYRYTDRPMSVKDWTDKFVYSKRDCKVTTKYSEYDVNPQTEDCYVIYTNMHYRLPLDIHNEEVSGHYKSATTESELKTSFNYAFNK